MRLLVTRRLTQAAESALSARFDASFRDQTTPLTVEEAREALTQYDAILPTLGDGFQAGAFSGPIRAGILANFGVGFDHIDIAAAAEAGIVVTNTPDVVTEATADLAATLLLMTARRAIEGADLARSGDWQGWHPTQLLGATVSGRRVGIVGMGRIGKAIARRLHLGFGMEVAFYNRSQVNALDIPARQVADLRDLMQMVDFAVLAVPGGAQTRQLIGKAALDALGPDGILINIARGDVVDEPALIEALETGRIRAAGLDVYAREPVIPPALRACKNAVLLPHLGTAVEDTRTAMARRAMANLIAFSEGESPPDLVSA